jgi:UDP-3-O-[3-hydroxymyristoyl] glucosamine N-acyltransferase
MTEPVFFKRPIGLNVAEIAERTGATIRAGAHGSRLIYDIAPLDRAGPSDLTFLENSRYLEHLVATCAGACLLAERFADRAPAHVAVLLVREPYRAFVTAARALFADAMRPSSLFDAKGVASGAHVHPSARLENGVTIDPGAVIGPGAEIGSGTVIAATAVVGPQVRIGRDCTIGGATTITHALVGDRVIIHPGCRIGQDGFGYLMGAQSHTKVPQVARVIIQDEVEIGAGATIDRGGIRDTVIGAGSKIDNLVQVGHNVVIGRHCLIVAQTGISGSVMLGDFVVLGARVGINNHVTIGEGAQIAAISIVNDDVPPGARWGGTPAKPVKQWFREMLTLERLAARVDAGKRQDEP